MINFNKIIASLLLTGATIASLSAADGTYNYGFAPVNPAPEELNAHGTAMNYFMEAVIKLDASDDPVLASLKGKHITGVRCYLRQDYKQKSQRFSGITGYQGNLEEEGVITYSNFQEGWNEVSFSEPILFTGDEPVYVGMRVLETKGAPYPFVSYNKVSVDGAFFINSKKEGFKEYFDKGTLLIEAIFDADEKDYAGNAFVQAGKWPRVVAPNTYFDCNLYVKNQGPEEVSSLEVTSRNAEGKLVDTFKVNLDPVLAPYDGLSIPWSLMSPPSEGENVVLTLTVTGVNGNPAESKTNTIALYQSEDAFLRIPLVEEFTGLTCINCPFMFYFLDQALEDFGENHVYVAHHAGFQADKFTQPVDESLIYLFNSEYGYNPAVMYDRRILSGNGIPVMGANEASKEPYALRLEEVMDYPAQARVMVDMDIDNDEVKVVTYGKLARSMFASIDDLYLSTYLIEDGIGTENAPQRGVTYDPIDGAPDDLVDVFRHNGVIRVNFCVSDMGDKFEIDSEGNFKVEYPAKSVDAEWAKENLSAVAFVHKINKDDLADNYVLNAGANYLNAYVSGVENVMMNGSNLSLWLDAAGYLCSSSSLKKGSIHDLTGRKMTCAEAPGVYILSGIGQNGERVSVKVIRR